MTELKPIFESDRLYFIKPREQHSSVIETWIQDPKVMEFQGGPWIGQPKLDFLNFIKWHWDQFGFGHFLSVLKEDLTPIGLFSLKYIGKSPEGIKHRPDLGYLVEPEYWGRGYATEGARAIVEYGFKELGFAAIGALNYPENKASKNLLQKIGFVEEGSKEIIYNGRNLGTCMSWVCDKK